MNQIFQEDVLRSDGAKFIVGSQTTTPVNSCIIFEFGVPQFTKYYTSGHKSFQCVHLL